jgi:hypothetical protein
MIIDPIFTETKL